MVLDMRRAGSTWNEELIPVHDPDKRAEMVIGASRELTPALIEVAEALIEHARVVVFIDELDTAARPI